MHFRCLEVTNFRAIKHVHLSDLSNMVVIAGPNGCGKSCLFDAIRLIKSACGGYQPNEWQQFFGEFQIRLDRQQPELLGLFQDRTKSLDIKLEVVLDDTEKDYIRANARDLILPLIWYRVAPETGSYRRVTPMAAQLRDHGSEVEEKTKREIDLVLDDLNNDSFWGELTISPDDLVPYVTKSSPALELIFSVFEPQHIGIVDYHGPQRTYQREQITGINLNIESTEHQLSQHALYNYASKYSSIKTEMAASFIRDLLAKAVGATPTSQESLLSTLKELFDTFFPGKKFLGPQPTVDGRLMFPVRTEDGFEHDINDLSSGEKEVLYGYLRIHNVSPRNSVLLLDEPELHLNPRLIRGLPQFYHKHLGRALGNQIWLLTHSDTLLREALTSTEFSVFHMQLPSSVNEEENQIKRIQANDELERTVIDLVGDLATYRPGAKVVIFEGGGDTEFDLYVVNTLFPEFQNVVNAISGGNKHRVRGLHSLLDEARKAGALPAKFLAHGYKWCK